MCMVQLVTRSMYQLRINLNLSMNYQVGQPLEILDFEAL